MAMNIPENAIKTLTVEEIYDKEKYDLSTMEVDDVFKMLSVTSDGLTNKEVNERLKKFGRNEFYHKKENFLVEFLRFMWNPHSWTMEIAAFVAIAVSNGGGKPPDWEVFIGILLVLLTNSLISFIQQRQIKNNAKALVEASVLQAKVKRNGKWKVIEATKLVPGDIISIKSNEIIPADARFINIHDDIAIDQSALTGESVAVKKLIGDEILSGSICKQGEAEAIIIGTGHHIFFGNVNLIFDHRSSSSLQKLLTHIIKFCVINMIMFMIAEILVMYVGFHYNYRRGINNLLVLLIGGTPILMPTVLCIILIVGAKQLSKHKAIITHNNAIEELAGITVLCADITGILTVNKPVIDKSSIKKYSELEIDVIIHYAAIASPIQNQNAIDVCVIEAYGNIKKIREGIEELDFKQFNSVDKRTEITYKLISDDSVHRISKGMSRAILDLCERDKTNEQVRQLNDDVNEFAQRGLRALAVAVEDVPDGQVDSKGNGFKLIGLLPIYDPIRSDTKEMVEYAIKLGVQIKMITTDQLAIAKEIGRRIGIGDNIFLSKILKYRPSVESDDQDIDHLVSYADGFAGVYPEHKYEIVERLQNLGYTVAATGDGVNDAPTLSKANVGIAIANASDAACSAAEIILTEYGLSVIIEAIFCSRQIFQRMRSYIIYTCSITIRTIVGFSILMFVFKFDFPSFMILILGIVNDSTIIAISKGRIQSTPYPNKWNLLEIYTYAIIYGIYLAASTVVFFTVIVKTSFFQDKFGVEYFRYANNSGWNDPVLSSVVYLQVSIISQALIFVTCSRNCLFLERPSIILIWTFGLAQLIATFIAVSADWNFTNSRGCGWHWAGIVWIWNIIWFLPLDFLKFPIRAYFDSNSKKSTINRNGNSPKVTIDHDELTRVSLV